MGKYKKKCAFYQEKCREVPLITEMKNNRQLERKERHIKRQSKGQDRFMLTVTTGGTSQQRILSRLLFTFGGGH